MSSRSPWLARLAGDALRAADLYYQQGKLEQAATMYRRAGQFEQAARVRLEMGDRAAALALLVEGGDRLRAGELLAQAGDHRAALPHFEEAKAWVPAAESALALRQPERAARYFERAGQLTRAASCFEKAGELEEAARALERESRALAGRFRVSADESLRDQQRQADTLRASLLARLGRPGEAAELLLLQGKTAAAAELLERSGETTRAVRAWMEIGQPQRALPLLERAPGLEAAERASVYRQCQRYREAAAVYAEIGDIAEAAECREAAGQWDAAAALWEAVGEMDRAAELWSRGERWRDAARCFSAAGRPELAAASFEKAGDAASAAACYLEADRPLRAARAWLVAGDEAAAARALQQIPETSPDFERATMLLVPLLVKEGLHEGALHRLELLPQDVTATGGGAVDRQYWEARALEGVGRLQEAVRAYERSVALRRDHRDALARLEELRKVVDSGSAPTSPSSTLRMEPIAPGGGGGSVPADLRVGTTLAGRYRLLGELGRGGMGRVYKAEDRELGDVVAVKTLLAASYGSAEEDRLIREVQICRRITHPNVVRVYDIGRFQGGVFVTMEYLEGRTLDHVMRERGQLPLGEAREMLAQILAGLQEAHALRVVHRDLKPSNVLLAGERVKILDFGIARVEGGDGSLTMAGEVLGSPKYMSPEQIHGEELDGRSDLYSLGVLAYALIAGREPFTGGSPSAIAIKQIHEPPPDVLQLRPGLPVLWQELLVRLLAKRPEERYGDASEALAAVRALPG